MRTDGAHKNTIDKEKFSVPDTWNWLFETKFKTIILINKKWTLIIK